MTPISMQRAISSSLPGSFTLYWQLALKQWAVSKREEAWTTHTPLPPSLPTELYSTARRMYRRTIDVWTFHALPNLQHTFFYICHLMLVWLVLKPINVESYYYGLLYRNQIHYTFKYLCTKAFAFVLMNYTYINVEEIFFKRAITSGSHQKAKNNVQSLGLIQFSE